MDALSVRDVRKSYSIMQNGAATRVSVLDGVSLKVKKGEFIGLIGPNGCGKTTLLKLILGVERPDSGSISVSGNEPEKIRMGYVPQHSAGSLYPWFTAAENVAFAYSSGEEDAAQKAVERLDEFGVRHYANAYPYQMSGGIKQLVSIARATVCSEVFLFDEPFNGLDYQNRFAVERKFMGLKDGNNSAILISHDIESAVLTCDKLVILSKKPSTIRAVLPVGLPEKRNHKTRFSREFNLVLRQAFEIIGCE